jgi:tetratricopeptide (TPR) repeat protein
MKVRLLFCLFTVAAVLTAQNAEALLSEGIENFDNGKYKAALEKFSEALKLSPADARAITYQQLTRAMLGDCVRPLNELVLQSKRNPDANLRRRAGIFAVRCLAARNDIAEALPLLGDLLERNPSDPEVLYEAAETFQRAYNVSMYQLFGRAPASYRVNQLSAQILERQGRFAEAVSEWKKAIEKSPTALQLHEQLGRDLVREASSPESLENARLAFEAELALNPDSALVELELGQVLFTQQKRDEAAACFEKSLQLRPSFAEALVALARVRNVQKQPEAAVKLLQKAIQIAPGLADARTDLIQTYRDLGRTKDAQREQTEWEKRKKAEAVGTNDALDHLRAKQP